MIVGWHNPPSLAAYNDLATAANAQLGYPDGKGTDRYARTTPMTDTSGKLWVAVCDFAGGPNGAIFNGKTVQVGRPTFPTTT